MKAITVEPKKSGTAKLEEVPEPDVREGSVLVEAIAVGVCGTDVEIVEGKYGWAPPSKTRLVLGHESLGRVSEPDPTGRLKKGDLVVGIVRRPDPVPCPNCAVGEWDMCRNGQYTERGIKQIDGYMSERWRIEPDYAIKVDSSLGLLRRFARAHDGRHKGVGAGQRNRPACLLGAEACARDGCRPNRAARGIARNAARVGRSCSGSSRVGTQAGSCARTRRNLPFRYCRGYRLPARCHHRMHRCRTGRLRFHTRNRARRDRLSRRCWEWRPPDRCHYGRHCGGGGAEEQCRRGQRQRQQAALV